jgi:hypothetical protein
VPVDLNVEADAPAEDDEDDIDWEEGWWKKSRSLIIMNVMAYSDLQSQVL